MYIQRNLGDWQPPWYCQAIPILPSCFEAAVGVAEDTVYNAVTGDLSPDQVAAIKAQAHADFKVASHGDEPLYQQAVAQGDKEIDAAAKPTIPWATIALIGGGVLLAVGLGKMAKSF